MPHNIRPDMVDSLEKYINYRTPVGGFLRSVISNDLSGAVFKADFYNVEVIPDYIFYLRDNAPPQCWGSPEAYETWIAKDS